MDFVERIFGISPDNGTGSFELSVIVLAFIVIAGKWVIGRRAKRMPPR
ncbi:MAG: hypothetical protein JO182_20955 [Acidobacteriaceae bacterium]|nr:hypothetical protein [Acidobacteriaceae bacterium]